MRVILKYLGSEYRRRAYYTLRQFTFLSLITMFVFLFAAIWPAINFLHTATHQFARYNLHVNGPLTTHSLQKLLDPFKANGSKIVKMNMGAVQQLSSNSVKGQGANIAYFDPKEFDLLDFTIFSKELILEGTMDSPKAVGIDLMIAKHLNVQVGSKVHYKQTFVDSNGKVLVLRQSNTITAIFAPTFDVNGLIAPMNQKVRALLGESGVAYSDVFITRENATIPQELIAVTKSSDTDFSNFSFNTIEEARTLGKQRVEQTINRDFRTGAMWIAMGIYFIYILREQFLRIDRRKKQLAILLSLGLRRSYIYQLFLIEQFALNTFTAIIGFIGGLYLLQDVFGIFVPLETEKYIGGVFFAANIVVLAVTSLHVSHHLRRFDVAKLLTTD